MPIVPAFNPDTGASGGPTPGGGGGYPALVPPADPADQNLAAGSTSSSAISWGTPTGGSGSVTSSDSLDQVVGTGASLSGTSVVSLENYDVCKVTRTWTDATAGGQTVSASTVITVAGATGAYDWSDEVFFAFQDATLAGPWTTGTNAVTGAATNTVNVVTTRSSTTDGIVEVVADGLETSATTGGGNINSAVDMGAYLSVNDAYFTDEIGVVVVQACYVLSDLGGAGAYWAAGVSNKNIQGQAFCGVAINYSAGNAVATTYYDTTSGVTLYSGAIPTDWRVSVYIYQGRVSRVKFEANVSTPTAEPPSSGWTFTGMPVLAANTAQFFGSAGGAAFKWLTSVRSNGHVAGVTLTDLRVWRLEAV